MVSTYIQAFALRSVVISSNLINVQQTGNTDKQIHRGISQSCGVD
jgi:hypothetical protein